MGRVGYGNGSDKVERTPVNQRLDPIHLRYRQRRLFARQVSASADIAAPIDAVWAALVDFDHYGDWNIFTPRVDTDLEVGSAVKTRVVMPGRSSTMRTEWINLVEPGKTICWGMHMGHPALLCANRWQMLSVLENGQTRYETIDKFSGLLTPLVLALYGRPMQTGFQSVADGLKKWLEEK